MASMPTVSYETTVFTLKSDRIGPNKATLLHARTKNNDSANYKTILYIHGFFDYFFQDHVCQRFLDHGYDFYALDLRKCGRSIISPEHDQYKYYTNDLSEYYEEITLAIEHIIQQANNRNRKIVVLGHSTGGLIATLYARSGARRSDIDALILNSPYFSRLEMTFFESIQMKMLIAFGLVVNIPAGWYGRSIHVSGRGEWDFDLTKKPIDHVRFFGHFFHAVTVAQQELIKKPITIECPILLLCSDRSIKPGKNWNDDYAEVDIILNVTPMKKISAMIGNQVTVIEIEKAVHDVFLSKESVREKAFERMFTWLKHVENDWVSAVN